MSNEAWLIGREMDAPKKTLLWQQGFFWYLALCFLWVHLFKK
jgi:hypothetical protein